ncbi:MAG TPA: HD domain-containing protein [Candidatus Sulfotelmatobacter sp.]|jgi:putative hydrolase of HD superfamily|nr:HD domain-containing protein [Candidatus Sulfotelmatobacter sp.]
MEEKIIQFLREAEKLKSTLRHNWTTTGRQEDSSQHSWRAALFFIIAQRIFHFDVDPYKTVTMLIIHDMPELKYGDIAGFVKDLDPKAHKEHKLREAQAARVLYSMLPSPVGEEFIIMQEALEKGESKEAKVAQAIEKIESQLQHLESGPEYWSDEERGYHMLHYPDNVLKKLNDPHINKIWKLIYDEIYKLTYPEK